METIKICPKCAAALPVDAPAGLCPKCLLNAGFESNSGAAANPTAGFTPPDIATLARSFPQLEILKLVGMGGMGVVYKVRQIALDRVVALKILPPETGRDPAFAERFSREARALAKLSHPNIVGIFDFGQAGEFYYFLMEFVDGVNLRQMLKAQRLAPREALAIVPQVCDALQYAHDQGIVHRDIKPENILMDRRGRVRIADFGLARLLGPIADARLTQSQHVMGTPHYMAPEQFEHPLEVDHRADIYSLGVVLYEMLTGELPLGRFALPSQKVQVDVRLDDIVIKTLEKEPARRYQHASDVKTEMETLAGVPWSQLPPGMRNMMGIEYRSKATIGGLPLLHVSMGFDPKTGKQREARGIIAVGGRAIGVVAFGGIARGVFAFGGVALGVMAVGGVCAGLFSLGGCALALMLAWGGLAVGPIAFGGLAIGYYAAGGLALGVHAMGSNARGDAAAMQFFKGWSRPWVNVVVMAMLLVPMFFQMAVVFWARARANSGAGLPGAPAVSATPRVSRKAIAGLFWAPLLPIALAVFFFGFFALHTTTTRMQSVSAATSEAGAANAQPSPAPSQPPAVNNEGEDGPSIGLKLAFIIFGLLGISAPFGTTICGVAAISDIRRSKGLIHGLPLALGDALLYPLLLLDGAIVAAFAALPTGLRMFGIVAYPPLIFAGVALGILVALAVDALLVVMAWRAVKRPVT